MPETYAFLTFDESSHLRKTCHSHQHFITICCFKQLLTHEGAKCQQACIHLLQQLPLLRRVMCRIPDPQVRPGLPWRMLWSLSRRNDIGVKIALPGFDTCGLAPWVRAGHSARSNQHNDTRTWKEDLLRLMELTSSRPPVDQYVAYSLPNIKLDRRGLVPCTCIGFSGHFFIGLHQCGVNIVGLILRDGRYSPGAEGFSVDAVT
jgi:hypothetical protein